MYELQVTHMREEREEKEKEKRWRKEREKTEKRRRKDREKMEKRKDGERERLTGGSTTDVLSVCNKTISSSTPPSILLQACMHVHVCV